MKQQLRILAVVVAFAMLGPPRLATAQASIGIPPAITTPDKVETRVGTMEFKDGAPSQATLDKVYDNLDFTHAFEAAEASAHGAAPYALVTHLRQITTHTGSPLPCRTYGSDWWYTWPAVGWRRVGCCGGQCARLAAETIVVTAGQTIRRSRLASVITC
jgi:hypothetical protein